MAESNLPGSSGTNTGNLGELKLSAEDYIGKDAQAAERIAREAVSKTRVDKVRRLAQAKYRRMQAQAVANLPATTDDIAASQFGRDVLKDAQKIGPQSDLFLARKLYIQGVGEKEIEVQTGIPKSMLKNLIDDETSGWKLQRDRVFENIGQELSNACLPVMKDIKKTGLALIKSSLDARAALAEDKPITLSEGKQIATILAFVTQEIRLDEDTLDEKKQKSLTTQEIFDSFVDDPYLGPAIKKMARNAVPVEVKPNE
jgi:hypothetical protein